MHIHIDVTISHFKHCPNVNAMVCIQEVRLASNMGTHRESLLKRHVSNSLNKAAQGLHSTPSIGTAAAAPHGMRAMYYGTQ